MPARRGWVGLFLCDGCYLGCVLRGASVSASVRIAAMLLVLLLRLLGGGVLDSCLQSASVLSRETATETPAPHTERRLPTVRSASAGDAAGVGYRGRRKGFVAVLLLALVDSADV